MPLDREVDLRPGDIVLDGDPAPRLATIVMDQKLGGCCAFFSGGAGSPLNTVAWTEAYLHTIEAS